jgi:hypothetical protein
MPNWEVIKMAGTSTATGSNPDGNALAKTVEVLFRLVKDNTLCVMDKLAPDEPIPDRPRAIGLATDFESYSNCWTQYDITTNNRFAPTLAEVLGGLKPHDLNDLDDLAGIALGQKIIHGSFVEQQVELYRLKYLEPAHEADDSEA